MSSYQRKLSLLREIEEAAQLIDNQSYVDSAYEGWAIDIQRAVKELRRLIEDPFGPDVEPPTEGYYAYITLPRDHPDAPSVVFMDREQYDDLRAALVSQSLDQARRVGELEKRLKDEQRFLESTDRILDLLPESVHIQG